MPDTQHMLNKCFPKRFKARCAPAEITVQMDKSPEVSMGPGVRWWKKTKIETGLMNGNKQPWIFFSPGLFDNLNRLGQDF